MMIRRILDDELTGEIVLGQFVQGSLDHRYVAEKPAILTIGKFEARLSGSVSRSTDCHRRGASAVYLMLLLFWFCIAIGFCTTSQAQQKVGVSLPAVERRGGSTAVSTDDLQWRFPDDRQARVGITVIPPQVGPENGGFKGPSTISDEKQRNTGHQGSIVGERTLFGYRVFGIRLVAGLGGIVLVILGAMMWTRTLRRIVKQRTSQLHQELIERQRAEIDLDRLNRELHMLGDISQAMIHITDESKLLNEACRIVVEVGGYHLAWIGFVEHDEEKALRLVAHSGFDTSLISLDHTNYFGNEREIRSGSMTICSGQPGIARNLLTDPDFADWREAAIQGGYQSYIALPLVSEEQTFGAMLIYSNEADAFDTKEVEILQRLASELAFGISALQTQASREQAEKAKNESEAFLLSIIENIPHMIFIKDAKELKF
ncbi:MAG: GAF domain-containing protein, partial [Candidatus Promineifilaceae bacterium]